MLNIEYTTSLTLLTVIFNTFVLTRMNNLSVIVEKDVIETGEVVLEKVLDTSGGSNGLNGSNDSGVVSGASSSDLQSGKTQENYKDVFSCPIIQFTALNIDRKESTFVTSANVQQKSCNISAIMPEKAKITIDSDG